MRVKFLGWCHQPTRGHDKVWGLIDKGNGEFMTFWGRRGNKLQTNTKPLSEGQQHTLISSKLRKGYRKVEKEEMDTVYDHFGRDVFKIILKGG